ncbi:MAG: hypothetical protein K8U03_18140 [Planctomycetia bacterium]|nr:hypothetical protein [Planctomycetia bacterium]
MSLLFFATILYGANVVAAESSSANPEWIWNDSAVGPTGRFTKNIELVDAIQAAGLKLAADGCRASVVINGRTALTLEPYCPTQEFDVTRWMQRGKNELVVTAIPAEGPPAVALSLTVLTKNGERSGIVSDATWNALRSEVDEAAAESRPAKSLGQVRPELWGIDRRPAIISPFENYEQWKQTLSSTKKERSPRFWTAPGFELTLLRTALPDEGSWISMAFEPQGRLTVSREDRGLLQLTLDEARKSVTHVEHVKLPVDECRGLLYAYDRLYLNANNSQAMFSARPTGDGKFSDLTKLREFKGKVGHGRNDLASAPEGRIYSMHGDSVFPPGEPILDRTSPLRESRQLIAQGKPPRREGHLIRTDAEAKHWELICTGLRNPYGVAVHPNGDVFTYDADNESDMATPWYRPTRIVQLVSGADYGYRDNGDLWPVEVPDRPDNGLPLIDVGRGSPTSAMFGEKLAFPSPYREALFVLDWSYGRVLAVHLAPNGFGYRAALELFLQGQPLNVTDLAAGPDGAMYLITGGRKTQSALYRVAFTGPKPEPTVNASAADGEVHRRQSESFASEQRTLRRSLEALHGTADSQAIAKSLPQLASSDPMIRHAARIAIEQRAIESWSPQMRQLVTAPESETSALHDVRLDAAMMLIRAGRKDAAPDILQYLTSVDLAKADVGTALIVVHLFDQCRLLAPDAFAQHRAKIGKQLLAGENSVSTESLRVSPYGSNVELRRRVARLLGDMHEPSIATQVVEYVAKALLKSSIQEDRLAGLLALRNQRDGWTRDSRRFYFKTLQEASRFIGGQGMPMFVELIRKEATATLSDAEKGQLADVLNAPTYVEEPLPPTRPVVKKWKVADLAVVYADPADRSVGHSGDAARGASLFRGALCSRCHRSGLAGPAVGPDLTFVARRFSRRDILESIIAPSLSVAENYRNAQVITESGLVHTGRVVSEGDFRSAKLKLNTDPLRPSQTIELDKQEIAEYRSLGTSPMPEGLLDSLTLEEIADLLAFLESGIAE